MFISNIFKFTTPLALENRQFFSQSSVDIFHCFFVILFYTFLSVLRLFCLDPLLCLIFELVHERFGVSDSTSSLAGSDFEREKNATFVASVASSLKALGLENKTQIRHFVN